MLNETICQPVEVLESHKYFPCISLIMPFEPQTAAKAVLVMRLNNAVAKITEDLKDQYPDDKWLPGVKRLGHIIKDLNYYTFKKSIAMFMSPLAVKFYCIFQ